MDFKRLASRLGMDQDDVKELVDLFITTSLADIDKIKKGVQAGNCEQTAAAAHSIKGAAGNLGLDAISVLSRDMEMNAGQGCLDTVNVYIHDLENLVNDLK